MRRVKKKESLPEKPPKSARMTAAERRKRIQRGAKDFAVRFEQVMRELAKG